MTTFVKRQRKRRTTSVNESVNLLKCKELSALKLTKVTDSSKKVIALTTS